MDERRWDFCLLLDIHYWYYKGMGVSQKLKKLQDIILVCKKFSRKNARFLVGVPVLVFVIFATGMIWQQSEFRHQMLVNQLAAEKESITKTLQETDAKLVFLENEDQKIKNDELQVRIQNLQKTNSQAVVQYERILKVRDDGAKVDEVEKKWAAVLSLLAKNEYDSALSSLTELSTTITEIEKQLAAKAALNIPSATASNTAPASGFQRQSVDTSVGPVVISLIAGDLSTTKVIVDTASASDCKNDCPVLPLGDYVARNGAFAGINGSYFCPASYPSCADKKNSYDLLVMNKDKVYFNSDNNVYSTNPAVIFHGGSVSFVGATSQWGRDTGIDSLLSNFPLLLSGGEVRFTGDGDPKKGSKSNRSFVANKGTTVYIGVVHGSTVAEAAIALKTLGMDNAMNLDSGGSTALWSGGYKVGPGRAIPNAILFVRR